MFDWNQYKLRFKHINYLKNFTYCVTYNSTAVTHNWNYINLQGAKLMSFMWRTVDPVKVLEHLTYYSSYETHKCQCSYRMLSHFFYCSNLYKHIKGKE